VLGFRGLRTCGTTGVDEKDVRGVGGKSEGKMPLVRPRCRR